MEIDMDKLIESAQQAALSLQPECPEEFLPYADEWNREYVYALFDLDCASH